jgi:hypothetical protein
MGPLDRTECFSPSFCTVLVPASDFVLLFPIVEAGRLVVGFLGLGSGVVHGRRAVITVPSGGSLHFVLGSIARCRANPFRPDAEEPPLCYAILAMSFFGDATDGSCVAAAFLATRTLRLEPLRAGANESPQPSEVGWYGLDCALADDVVERRGLVGRRMVSLRPGRSR